MITGMQLPAQSFDQGMSGMWQCIQKTPQGPSRLIIDIAPEGDYTLKTIYADGTQDEEQGQMDAASGKFTSTSEAGSTCSGMYRIAGKRMTIFIEKSGGCVWERVTPGSNPGLSGLGTGVQQATPTQPGAPTGPTSSDYQPGAPTISNLRRGVATSTTQFMRNGLLNAISPITRGMPNFAQYTIKGTAHDGASKVSNTIMGTNKKRPQQKAAPQESYQQPPPANEFAPTYIEEPQIPAPKPKPRKNEDQSGF